MEISNYVYITGTQEVNANLAGRQAKKPVSWDL